MLHVLDGRLVRLPTTEEIDAEIARRAEEKYANQSEAQFKKERKRQAKAGGLLAFIRYFWSVLEPVTPLVEGWALEAICRHLEAVTFGEITRLLINVPPGFMKAIDCETPVLTTWGWKRHGDLRPNDFVFAPDGFPRRVEAVTPHKSEASYEIEFDDETKIVAGAGHLWEVERDYPYGGPQSTRIRRPMVVATPELIASVKGRNVQRPDRIPLCGPIQFPPRRLLIDPYLLGAWLGDGATLSGVLYCAEQDRPHFEKLGRVTCTMQTEGRQDFHRIGIDGFQTKLRVLGLLGNKHIPDDYLEASIDQRMELLRGLMDTDGHAAKATGTCSYVTKLRHLADQIVTLLCSLGIKANVKESYSTINGEKFGPYRSISFTAPEGMKVFNLERKQAKMRPAQNARSRGRYVKSVRQVGDRWINCIQVEGGLYLVGKRLVTTHNSLLVNVFFPAWEWGPMNLAHLRYLAFSYSPELTERDNGKFLALVDSARYKNLWGTHFGLRQKGALLISNDRTGSKRASSIGGVGTGERGDRVMLDDPHNVIKIESKKDRESKTAWFRGSMSNRLNDMQRSAIVVIMQRLHEDDVSGVILENEFNYCHLMIPMEFAPERYPVSNGVVDYEGNDIGWIDPRALDERGKILAPYDLDQMDGTLAWPERFPAKVAASLKHELGPYAYAGQYQQSPMPRKGMIFDPEWWHLYEPPESGKFPPMEFVLASLDSAFTEKEENDPSGFTLWGVWRPIVTNAATGEGEYGTPQIMLMWAWRKHLQIHGVDVKRKQNETEKQFIRRAMPKWGLVEWVAHSCRRFGGADMLLIEAKASGIDVINEMRRLYADEQWGLEGRQSPKDKVSRALAVQPTFSQEIVWAPLTDWADMVQKEMSQFPKGRFKDLTDSATQAVKWLREKGLIQRPEEISRLERARSEFRKSRPKVLYEA